MAFATFAFYLFAVIAVVAGAMVIFARNPVHSVLWLILAFFSAAGLFVLLGAEFVAMIMLIVYVGAVAVLFLFVVMMLDVNFAELREGMARLLPIGLLIGVVLLVQLGFVFGAWETSEQALSARQAITPAPEIVDNTTAIGKLLYTRYIFLFQTAGLVLLVAMIGAIVLTLRKRQYVKRQDVLKQMYRDPKAAVNLVDIKPGQGA
ncbi:NADH-quinone oxidoreductase subunit J [Amaricoccus sp.]|uniref:NADH-quinone oxidoreductase subunit J n=1 Tax=Amaricoccus sp. TaxID=1872485 RepID=UPI00260A7869|nr:NADH-quinone oxidoreductase subunit J [Amaricoccus sp.]HRO11825.1 NADH-quinone oxidoreductase subunit J [Amaricoccus sp.]